MITAGMNVARLNLSHGGNDDNAKLEFAVDQAREPGYIKSAIRPRMKNKPDGVHQQLSP